ncbi:hypothetical protein FI667_g11330, partial [Globisporangium splendens]
MEQSSSLMSQEQLAALRQLAASAAKPTSKLLLNRQLASHGASSSLVMPEHGGGRPPSGLPTHPQKTRGHQDFSSSNTPVRSKSHALGSFTLSTQQRAPTKTVGGFKSCTVQLEVELAERLNEIERSKARPNFSAVSSERKGFLLPSSLSASVRCRDPVRRGTHIVVAWVGIFVSLSVLLLLIHFSMLTFQQYGRLLSKIRDEFNSYLDSVSRNNRALASSQERDACCSCQSSKGNNQTNRTRDLDFASVLSLHKLLTYWHLGMGMVDRECASSTRESGAEENCATMQREIEILQKSLAFASSQKDERCPEQDEADANLLDGIPPLNFAALSPYSEEADEDDDDVDDEY